LPLQKLNVSIPIYNIDGTLNAGGYITHKWLFVVEYQDHREHITAEVTQLGKINLILGCTWLVKHNPEID
ncbi:hypothetical protein SERLA73DRAFT_43588, partial [Serpula lacrymans var. lacrymans S7.3]